MGKNPERAAEIDFTATDSPFRQAVFAAKELAIKTAANLALNELQVFSRVVLPPALGRVWPALTSQFVIVMLGSAVCGQIAAQELSYAANLIQSRNFRAFEAYIIATANYLLLSIGVRQLLNWMGPKFIFGRLPNAGR